MKTEILVVKAVEGDRFEDIQHLRVEYPMFIFTGSEQVQINTETELINFCDRHFYRWQLLEL